MGKVFSPKKPSGPTPEEQELARQRKLEQERAEADRTREIQEGLKNQTLAGSGKVGRKSLLSRGSTGFSTVSLRSLLGGG